MSGETPEYSMYVGGHWRRASGPVLEVLNPGPFRLSLGTALRHGLHDSEHHVLDFRRGTATIILALWHSALRERVQLIDQRGSSRSS